MSGEDSPEIKQWRERLAKKWEEVKRNKKLSIEHLGGKDNAQEALERINKDMQEWLEKNPKPETARPKPFKAKPMQGAGSMDDFLNQYQTFDRLRAPTDRLNDVNQVARNVRRARRGQQGISTLGLAAAGGWVGLGLAALKIVAEEVVFYYAEKGMSYAYENHIRYALMPTTVAQAEAEYKKYVINERLGGAVRGMVGGGRHGLNPLNREMPVLSRDEWLMRTYGLHWEALKR